jgi:hypothetical protein
MAVDEVETETGADAAGDGADCLDTSPSAAPPLT